LVGEIANIKALEVSLLGRGPPGVGRFLLALLHITGRGGDEAPKDNDLDMAYNSLGEIMQRMRGDAATPLWVPSENDADVHRLDERQTRQMCSLTNQALAAIGRETVGLPFYSVVFNSEDPATVRVTSIAEFYDRRAEMVRQLYMYFFGNFKAGFRKIRHWDEHKLREHWDQLFTERKIEPREQIVGFQRVDTDMLWALGYVSVGFSKEISKARARLQPILDEAVRIGSNNVLDVDKIWKRRSSGTSDTFDWVFDRAALPPEANLFPAYDQMMPFSTRLENARKFCSLPVEERVDKMIRRGRLNTFAYLTIPELDIYFATSMRVPSHFYNAARIVHDLFESGQLEKYHLSVFDPTQSFSHERLDKGLVESLMIARSKITVYNAQDEDTFGKDSEAAVSLAQCHPVVVYIARLFPDDKRLADVRRFLRLMPGRQNDLELLEDYVEEFNVPFIEKEKLKTPGPVTKDAIVAHLVEHRVREILSTFQSDELRAELLLNGYSVGDSPDTLLDPVFLRNEAEKLIGRLERRALIFLQGHPLALQVSPKDGVARGVIVSRDLKEVASVIEGLLSNTLQYKITNDEYCWKLEHESTHSPVRVVTSDPTLTASFWETFFRGEEFD